MDLAPRKLVAVLIILAFIVAALSTSFDKVALSSLGGSPEDRPIGDPIIASEWTGNADLPVDQPYPSVWPVFVTENARGASYLRTNVLTTYSDGAWHIEDGDYQRYDGSMLDVPLDLMSAQTHSTLTITPLRGLGAQLPVVKNTYQFTTNRSGNIEYSALHQTFRTDQLQEESYDVTFIQQTCSEGQLRASTVSGDPASLQLPAGLDSRNTELATYITQGVENPYDKAVALRDFLKSNYFYEGRYTPAPAGTDPVSWFLFSSKKGMCTHFNSAFVLMARSIGLPAQLVTGYLIMPSVQPTEVFSNQAHAYAEVRFDGRGWITFDATPSTDDSVWRDPEEGGGSLSVGGRLFHDQNQNNLKETDELGLTNWTVALYDAQGVMVEQVRSDRNGYYRISIPAPGVYFSSVLYPDGWRPIGPVAYGGERIESSLTSWDFWFAEQPSTGSVTTSTTITSDGGDLYKGRPFNVTGMVTSSEEAVTGVRVLIYLSEEKTGAPRFVCGQGFTHDGNFTASCLIPTDLGLGSYQLIARAVGNYHFAASESDPEVTVRDTSSISVQGPLRPLVGTDSVYMFTLTKMGSREPIPHAEITVEANGTYYLITNDDGVAQISLFFPETGVVPFRVRYNGSQYVGGYVHSGELSVVPLTVTLLSNTLVRGEDGVIVGRAAGGDVPLADSQVYFTIVGDDIQGSDAQTFVTYTDIVGMFTALVKLSGQVELGAHQAVVRMSSIDHPVVVQVQARPVLEIAQSGNDLGLRLTDDRGHPLHGEVLNVTLGRDNYTFTTNGEGRSVVTIAEDFRDNCTASYRGSELYAPSEATLEVYGVKNEMLWWLLVPVLLVTAVLLLTHSRRNAPRPEPPAIVEETGIVTIDGPYRITSPQIDPSLPLTWLAEEPLTIKVSGGGSPLTLRLDGSDLRKIAPDGEMEIVLSRGAHALEVEGEEGLTRVEARGVLYREEVVRLFNESFDRWKKGRAYITDDLTPREVQAAMGEDATPARREALETMASLIERASYSTHPIDRTHYEMMYRATREVVI